MSSSENSVLVTSLTGGLKIFVKMCTIEVMKKRRLKTDLESQFTHLSNDNNHCLSGTIRNGGGTLIIIPLYPSISFLQAPHCEFQRPRLPVRL